MAARDVSIPASNLLTRVMRIREKTEPCVRTYRCAPDRVAVQIRINNTAIHAELKLGDAMLLARAILDNIGELPHIGGLPD